MYEWNECRHREKERREREKEGHFTPVGQESGKENEN
jgi:uncharacterized protein YlaI